MRVFVAILALAVGACTFDDSGSSWNGDDDDDDGVDAATPDAAPPAIDGAPLPSFDALPSLDALIACNFDGQCDSGEDHFCLDCLGGGGFECDFDQQCETGEDPNCLDCLGMP